MKKKHICKKKTYDSDCYYCQYFIDNECLRDKPNYDKKTKTKTD